MFTKFTNRNANLVFFTLIAKFFQKFFLVIPKINSRNPHPNI